MKKKREALEKEKLAKKEALEKEKEAKKEALEKEKAEKERQKEVEKRAKEIERLEKERVKKAEKEKLEAEKEKLKQEKEEERLKKKAEKEAELKQKEEERLKKEEEKRLLEEAEAFKSFFKKDDVAKERKVSGKEVEEVAEGALGNFTQFRVKDNMRLAPTVRNDPKMAMKRIDSLDMPAGPDDLYLALLKTEYSPGKQSRTWPYEKNVPKDDDIEVLEDEEEEESDPEDADKIIINGAVVSGKVPRAKLLQFHENQRPAYWGTWTKQSAFVSGRRPFGKDEERFEYDYDSDEDWEEEEEGESLSDNEDDKEKEEEKGDNEDDKEKEEEEV